LYGSNQVIDKKAALPPHVDGSVVFTRLCQCAPHLIHASCTASRLVQPLLNSSQQCRRACLGMSFPLKIVPSYEAIWTPSNTWFFRYPYTLEWATYPSKLPLPMERCGPPSNTWFLGPTWVLNPNRISIG